MYIVECIHIRTLCPLLPLPLSVPPFLPSLLPSPPLPSLPPSLASPSLPSSTTLPFFLPLWFGTILRSSGNKIPVLENGTRLTSLFWKIRTVLGFLFGKLVAPGLEQCANHHTTFSTVCSLEPALTTFSAVCSIGNRCLMPLIQNLNLVPSTRTSQTLLASHCHERSSPPLSLSRFLPFPPSLPPCLPLQSLACWTLVLAREVWPDPGLGTLLPRR